MQWEVVIGLEVHTQLATNTKIFSGSSTAYGAEPNTQANVIDLGMPGVLPVLNEGVIDMSIKLGLALDAEIGMKSAFDRKNYFYPDSPKGYQTSQLFHPIVGLGHMDITLEDGSTKRIGVTRAHLEEDAGKSMHDGAENVSLIDLNRAGTPLLEIVSEPDMRSAKEAVAYLKKLHTLVQYLEISDGNMQEGSFRCDANVSVRPVGQEEFGTRAELKNINSFRFVERAINVEIERQIDIIEGGGKVIQETRLYDSEKNETRSMRAKEDENDYRYFPCPDLLPLVITEADIERVRADMPELPAQKTARFMEEYSLPQYDAETLVADKAMSVYFEELVSKVGVKNAKLAANWIMGALTASLNTDEIGIEDSKVSTDLLAGMLNRIIDETISGKGAKDVFKAMWEGEGTADDIIEAKGLKQITDTGAIEAIIDEIIANNPGQVEQYRGGKEKLFGFFVGQTMKATQGKANPAQVNQMLKDKLKG